MHNNSHSPIELPTLQQIETERKRLQYKRKYKRTLTSTIAVLLVVAALAILVATLWMPVLRIYGSSMVPTLEDGQIVITVKSTDFKAGDIVAFYHGNKLLIKRYVAGPSDWFNIDKDGNLYINNVLLDEPYITDKALGETNIKLPYQVPDKKFFMIGDNRSVSIDSRNTAVGCIDEGQIGGKVVFRIWPFKNFGPVN